MMYFSLSPFCIRGLAFQGLPFLLGFFSRSFLFWEIGQSVFSAEVTGHRSDRAYPCLLRQHYWDTDTGMIEPD